METTVNEDDLLLEELYKFIVKSLPGVLGNEKITVGDQIYYMMINQGNFMTIRRFIGEHYRRGKILIFGKGTDYYIGINICNDGIEIGIIDSDFYYDHVINKTALLLNEETKEITGKIKKWEEHQVFDSGDFRTDCGGF